MRWISCQAPVPPCIYLLLPYVGDLLLIYVTIKVGDGDHEDHKASTDGRAGDLVSHSSSNAAVSSIGDMVMAWTISEILTILPHTLRCFAHSLWIGNSFMLVTSFGLMVHHLFGCWHGDRRLSAKCVSLLHTCMGEWGFGAAIPTLQLFVAESNSPIIHHALQLNVFSSLLFLIIISWLGLITQPKVWRGL